MRGSEGQLAREPADDEGRIAAIAERLLRAERFAEAINPLSEDEPALEVDDGYRIQLAAVKARKDKGARVVGKKAGLTSRAVQEMFGVHEPDYGHLFDDMIVANDGSIHRLELISPKAEPEIAFILAQDLGEGTGVEEVLAAARWVLPVLEIIDSRIKDWRIRLADTVADNASCGRVVLGPVVPLDPGLELARVRVTFEKNGCTVGTGTGADVFEHPARAVAWLANRLGRLGQPLAAGDLILPGALCGAVAVHTGDHIRARFEGLGAVGVSFIP